MPAVTTRITPSACGAISRASETGSTGGVSIRTSVSIDRSDSTTLAKRMWSISVGSGGTGPEVSTHRLG